MVSWKSGLLLLAVLAGLAVYAYASRPQPAPPKRALMPCGLLDTISLEIKAPDRTLLLDRPTPDAAWQVRQPVSAPGDPNAIAQLFGAVDSIKVLNTIAVPQPETAYGFDQPREVVTCRVTSGSSYTLSIGNQSFDSSGYYARKSGDGRVYVISSVEVDSFDSALKQPPVPPNPSPSPVPSPTPSA